jgi:hypothetical protein
LGQISRRIASISTALVQKLRALARRRRCRIFNSALTFFTLLCAALPALAQEPYFYKHRDFGSEAMYNPVSLVLNAGFDMMQVDRKRDLSRLPFAVGMRNVVHNLGDPFAAIQRYGWGDFMKDQVIPIGLSKKDGQWWPNYTLHLVGGGMTYVATTEWFEYHEFPAPVAFSIITMVVYHMVNEITENGAYEGDNVDPIADIYLFDAGGILLFSFDNVRRFFSEDLNLADWSLQPSFSLLDGTLQNNGQFFSIKWKFPFSERWHLFYLFGTNGLGGVSYKFDGGGCLSVGVGLIARDLILLNSLKNKKTLDLVPNIGVYYDVGNSLMTSLSISRKTDYMVNLNVYPGLVRCWGVAPGFWLVVGQHGHTFVGVTAAFLPAGLAYH